MRENKFRVFDEKEGVYFNGWDGSEITITFYQEENEKGEIGYIQYKDLGCNCNPDDACGGCVDIWQCEPLTKDSIIEQYTGLKDSKRTKEFPEGQEIYEGDVVKMIALHNDHNQRGAIDYASIYFAHGQFCIALDGHEIGTPLFNVKLSSSVEIIGNIYQDIHLLSSD